MVVDGVIGRVMHHTGWIVRSVRIKVAVHVMSIDESSIVVVRIQRLMKLLTVLVLLLTIVISRKIPNGETTKRGVIHNKPF